MSYDKQILGTLIASVLDYDNLIKITDDPKVIDPHNSGWVPADGRSIEGSKLHNKTGMKNAPDMRGKFTRGLNVIYSVGQPLPFDSGTFGDTDGQNRKAGEYQADLVGKHAHAIITADDGTPANSTYKITAYGKHQGTTLATEPNTGAETRPRNIAVYYYIKIN